MRGIRSRRLRVSKAMKQVVRDFFFPTVVVLMLVSIAYAFYVEFITPLFKLDLRTIYSVSPSELMVGLVGCVIAACVIVLYWRYSRLASKIYFLLCLHHPEIIQKYGSGERAFPLTNWSKPWLIPSFSGTISLTRYGIFSQFKTIREIKQALQKDSAIISILDDARRTLLNALIFVALPLLGIVLWSVWYFFVPN